MPIRFVKKVTKNIRYFVLNTADSILYSVAKIMPIRFVKKVTKNIRYFVLNTAGSILYSFAPSGISSLTLEQSVLRGLPIIGYLMVFMSIADCVFVAVPLQLQNPVWELATLGSISNHTWGILIGLGFVLSTFSRDSINRVRPIEIYIINLFRILILLFALMFFLALPLVVVNTFRVNDLEARQIETQVTNRKRIIAQVEENLNAINDIRQLLEIGQGLGLRLTYTPQSAPDSLKKQIREQLPGATKKLETEASMSISSKKKYQWKASARIFLQLFILSIANILLWFKTRRLKALIG